MTTAITSDMFNFCHLCCDFLVCLYFEPMLTDGYYFYCSSSWFLLKVSYLPATTGTNVCCYTCCYCCSLQLFYNSCCSLCCSRYRFIAPMTYEFRHCSACCCRLPIHFALVKLALLFMLLCCCCRLLLVLVLVVAVLLLLLLLLRRPRRRPPLLLLLILLVVLVVQ